LKLFWLTQARSNLNDAIAYIAEENPRAAIDQLDKIEAQADKLCEFPTLGRTGRKAGTRELVINQTPFVMVYRVKEKAQRIEILRLLHGAQQWPKRSK
jgi:toxin ParE1/3/4